MSVGDNELIFIILRICECFDYLFKALCVVCLLNMIITLEFLSVFLED